MRATTGTAEIRERLADMIGQRDRWQQQAETVPAD
jgi:hypothetical protein